VDLSLSSEQSFFQETTRRFLETEAPLSRVRQLAGDPAGLDREWWRRGAELGWTSFLVPESHGGGRLSAGGVSDLMIVAEEFGRMVSPGPLHPTNIVAAALARSGSPDQQSEILPGIVSGEIVAAWCHKEPREGWRARDVGLEARQPADGGDGFVLSGTKTMVEAAEVADWLLVTARSDQGLMQLLLRPDTPGVTVTSMGGLDVVRRFGKVHFDEVAVPSTAVVGRGSGSHVEAEIESLVQIGAALECAQMAGAADRVLEFTVEYAFDRYSFGRQLASYQALKHRFADMKLWLEASHAAVEGAAQALDDGVDTARRVSAAKVYAGEHVPELIQDCVQLHGGIGLTWEHDIHLYLRRVTLARRLYGSPDEHRERLAVAAGLEGDAA
jgi:alkylation response protein AidB-like acyl-CoA dehydrogenase